MPPADPGDLLDRAAWLIQHPDAPDCAAKVRAWLRDYERYDDSLLMPAKEVRDAKV